MSPSVRPRGTPLGLLALLVPLLLLARPAAAEITLDAPASIGAGAPLPIRWSGEGGPRDFITVVARGTAEGKYADYQYARQSTVELRAPEEAGDYEIRYLDAKAPYETRARRTLTVTPVSATLEVPPAICGM